MSRVSLSLLATLAVAAAATAPLTAQSSAYGDARFTLGAAVVTQRVGDLNGWGTGPQLLLGRRFGRRVVGEAALGVLLGSSGFYDFTGLILDIGPALAFRGTRTSATLGAGLSAIVGGDSDGSGGGYVGPYVSGQGTWWVARRVGLTGRGVLRVVSSPRFAPSLAAGVTFGL